MTRGRETALTSESLVLIVQMLRAASLQSPQGSCVFDWGIWHRGRSLADDCVVSDFPLWQEVVLIANKLKGQVKTSWGIPIFQSSCEEGGWKWGEALDCREKWGWLVSKGQEQEAEAVGTWGV